MAIPIKDFLPQMSAVIRVRYDGFGNSFDLITLPGTSLTEEELQLLVGVNLALVSTKLCKEEVSLVKKGVKVLSIDGKQFNNKEAYVFERGVADVRVSLSKLAFPRRPPATLASEKEREERLRSYIATTIAELKSTFILLGMDASLRFKIIENELETTYQLVALERELQLLNWIIVNKQISNL